MLPPTPNLHRWTTRRALLARMTLVVGALASASPADTATHPAASVTHHEASDDAPVGGPRLVHGAVADVLVRVRGGAVCSGTPITGTRYVVTAAHCVLDHRGHAAARTVVRDGITYVATAVLVDDRYFVEPEARLDAAVLVMDEAVPGVSATVGFTIPTTGSVTIAGFQRLDRDGTLLRGQTPYDVLVPEGATGSVIQIEAAPAGCTVPAGSVSLAGGRVDISCGLIPGASGGGLFAELGGTIVLVGIVSTVTLDLSVNGVVPLASLHALLQNPERYWHDVTVTRRTGDSARLVLS